MIKNITIAVLIVAIVGLLVYVGILKKQISNSLVLQPNIEVKKESDRQVSVDTMTLLAESSDKKYSVFATYKISNQQQKSTQFPGDEDRGGKGDTVYVKDNYTGEVSQIFSDSSSEYMSVTSARFINDKTFVFINNALFKFDIVSKKLASYKPSKGSAWMIKDISPKGETLVLAVATSQETGYDTIVDLKNMKDLWSTPTWGGSTGFDIQKYKTENTLLYFESYEDPQTGNPITKDYIIDLTGHKI